jgi:hypothetical protein
MDAIGNDWNTAPACVLSTVWGTASVRDLAVEVGAVPASPIRQVLTSRQASCAGRNSPRARKPVDLWTTPRGVAHKPTGPTAAEDNLNNLEISSVRANARFPIGGSPERRPATAATTSFAVYTRVPIAVHISAARNRDAGKSALVRARVGGFREWVPFGVSFVDRNQKNISHDLLL